MFSVFLLNNYPSSGHGRETAWVRRLWLMVRINDSFLDTPALAASHRRKDPWHMAVRHKVRRKMRQNFCFCWIFRTPGMMGHFNNHETKYKRIVSVIGHIVITLHNIFTILWSYWCLLLQYPSQCSYQQRRSGWAREFWLKLETNLREYWRLITERASSRAFCWLKVTESAFTFKTLSTLC